jgi:hypothetical protein
MCRFITRFITVIFMGSLFLCVQAKAGNECAGNAVLKAHSGHYARKAFWEYLSKNKNWSVAVKKFINQDVSAINIDNEGGLSIWLHWWEALDSGCIRFRGNELWLSDDGPFIRVGQPFQENAIYTEKIFGKSCYQSDDNEKWCFTSDSIFVNSKRHSAELVLAAGFAAPGTPSYGIPLQMDEEDEKLWMFVPTTDGWKVFQDTFQDVADYKEVDPKKTIAWHELKRLSNGK